MTSSVYQQCCKQLLLTLSTLMCSTSLWAVSDYSQLMDAIIEIGDETSAAYEQDEALKFGDRFSKLYFGGFESKGLEFAVGQADHQAMQDIEIYFSLLINAAVSGKSKTEVQAHWKKLREKLINAPMIENQETDFWSLAIQSLLILLREGVEALLVVAALIAYLRKAGAADKVPYIWLGVGAALLASIATAWGIQRLIGNSGSAKEALEGVSMLLAALLLSYVSFWLFSRRETQQWQGFIHNKLGVAISSGNLFAIISVAFFSVYREGAETILFYQALLANASGAETSEGFEAIATGFGLALILLGIVYLFIFQLAKSLPLKQFFSATAGLLFVLSIIFAGKSVLELQVAGWVSNTHLEWLPSISWMGVSPSLESVSLQLAFIFIPFVFLMRSLRKKPEAETNQK